MTYGQLAKTKFGAHMHDREWDQVGRAKVNQLAGFVIDGAIRDVDAIEQLGVSVFARAVTPRRPL